MKTRRTAEVAKNFRSEKEHSVRNFVQGNDKNKF